jgi:hypothetical protein
MLGDPFITRLLGLMTIAVALASLRRLLLALGVAGLVAAGLALGAAPAHAFSCDQVRQYTAGKSPTELAALAKQYGVSDADVAKGKACLAGPKLGPPGIRHTARATARAARHAPHRAAKRAARARPHAAALPHLPRARPAIADERTAPVIAAPPVEPAIVVDPPIAVELALEPALTEPKPDDPKPAPEAPSPPQPKGHPMQSLTNLFSGLSWSTLILIAVFLYFVAKNGAPSVKAWLGRMRGYVGAGEATIKADIVALRAEVDAVKLRLGIPVPVPPLPAPPAV